MNYSRRQLEALGEPLGDSVTRKENGRIVYGGGGGSSGTPSQTTQVFELPEWARGYAQDTLAKAQAATSQPYQTYGAERIAGFSPLQLQAQQAAGNMGVAGQLGQASTMAGTAGSTTFGTPQAQQYMSPYIEAAMAPQLREAQRTSAMQGMQQQAEATGRGAFGGTRDALLRAERERNLNMGLNDIRARGYQTAFEQAGNLYNQDMNRQLQSAGLLGQLGQTQYGQQMGINQLQRQVGAEQQALRQQGLSQDYQDFINQQNYPFKQLGFMSDMIRGLPLGQQSAQQMYQGQPGAIQSLGSLGLGAYGLSRLGGFKEGGAVEMADGGLTGIDERVLANPTKYSEEQIRRSVKNGILDPETAKYALAKIAKAKSFTSGIEALASNLPTQGYAPGGIVAFDDGGEVQRYQSQGLVSQSTRWQDLLPYMGGAGVDVDRERAALQEYYGLTGGRAAIPRVNVPQVRGDVRRDPVTGRPITYAEFLRRQKADTTLGDPTAGFGGMPDFTAAAVADAGGAPVAAPGADGGAGADDSAGGVGAPAGGTFRGLGGSARPMGGMPAAGQGPMTALEILNRANQAAANVPTAGINAIKLPEITPTEFRNRMNAAMPEGEAAYTNPLTKKFEELGLDTRMAAQEAFQERQGIADRMDKLRESQQARYDAKKKDLETDRDRTVGIAFLEAAQAMAQPGKSITTALVEAGAAGGKRFLADKERLDKKADDLSEAINRLDESRVGDARERAAAKADLRQSVLATQRDLISHYQQAYGVNKADATAAVQAMMARETGIAQLALTREKTLLDAQNDASRNAIGAVGASAQMYNAFRNPTLETYTAVGGGDPTAGAELLTPNAQLNLLRAVSRDPRLAAAYRQMHPTERKTLPELFTQWMDKAGPMVQMLPPEQQMEQFLTHMRTLGGMGAGATLSNKPTGQVLNQPTR